VISTRPTVPVAVPLRELVDQLAEEVLPESRLDPAVVEATSVSGISLSTQRLEPGDLYAALPGSRAHGARFAADAVAAGAVAVLTDATGLATCAELDVPVVVVARPRGVLGALGAQIHDHPADALTLVAVTGTQGKTTTTRLAEGGLQAAGIRAAVVGTVGTRIDGVEVRTSLTTPEAPDLHALFAVMRERDVVGCAMEVSSHALVLGRVDGVVFDVAAFLNLGRDHLDFHADVEEYFAAKASLFTPQRARLGVVNIDDEHGRRLVGEATIPMRTFSTTDQDADWLATDVTMSPAGSRFTVRAPDGDRFPASVGLTGDFNVVNALCAIASLAEAGFDRRRVADGIAAAPRVPGRLEQVDAGQDFLAVVDYAHKPDAVTAALTALRPLTEGRLVVVIGAGGDRDPGKREAMGEIAATIADVVVVTDDNPRTEDPAAIRAALLAGTERVPASERAEVHEVGDRRTAIEQAVSFVTAGDTVVVAGKGHETGQEVDGQVHPFDDRVVLREAVAAR